MPDITSDAGLRQAIEAIGSPETWEESAQRWIDNLAETIGWVRGSDEAERSTREFQRRLWDNNHVAAVGQGNISVDAALDNAAFRQHVAARSMLPLPAPVEDRREFLAEFYRDLVEKVAPFVRSVPHLKIFRVIAVLYPAAMTTIASMGHLRRLTTAMGGDVTLDAPRRHVWVRSRLDSLLEDPGDDLRALAVRMALPWWLYERFAQPPPAERTETEIAPGETQLLPLPAARRRRGLTAIKGLYPGLLSALEFVRDGVTREELLDYLRSSSPDSKESSLRTTVNVYRSELGAIRLEGDRYVLTERGESTLNSQDPSDLADWLLTRILGVDNAIVALKENAMPFSDLTNLLRSVNPGWTSDYIPQAILAWLRSMGVLETNGSIQSLTEVGRQWADRIHWQPELLPADPPSIPGPSGAGTSSPRQPVAEGEIDLPELSEIVESIQVGGHFERSLIERLHFSLWAQPVRHFAILTGLSGSGKTLLARLYADALTRDGSKQQILTLPVQPGWYDPGALVGYTNPLRPDSYVRTAFLEFLMAAAVDPTQPYVIVLDEMNLSHPEQYMAPLLSAMETGDAIQLHTEGDIFDGVPRNIPYPHNLVLIGTVNMDETTHGLSDKVLDRAFVHEFWDIDLESYPRWGTRNIDADKEERVRNLLKALMEALAPAKLHFGWRTVDDILNFLSRAQTDGGELSFEAALDSVVNAKVLPKLRGDDTARFRDALHSCQKALSEAELTGSSAKIAELLRDLETTGNARFWR